MCPTPPEAFRQALFEKLWNSGVLLPRIESLSYPDSDYFQWFRELVSNIDRGGRVWLRYSTKVPSCVVLASGLCAIYFPAFSSTSKMPKVLPSWSRK